MVGLGTRLLVGTSSSVTTRISMSMNMITCNNHFHYGADLDDIVDNMGVDLATYRARIGSFISRRNVNCDDEKRKIAIIKERFRLKIGLKAVDSWKSRVLECATINASSSFRKCTQGLDVHVSTKLPMSLLSPKSAHVCHYN